MPSEANMSNCQHPKILTTVGKTEQRGDYPLEFLDTEEAASSSLARPTGEEQRIDEP
jgi:hypothetical protein